MRRWHHRRSQSHQHSSHPKRTVSAESDQHQRAETYTQSPHDRAVLSDEVAGPVVTQRDNPASIYELNRIDVIRIPWLFLGAIVITQTLLGLFQGDGLYMFKGTPLIHDVIGCDIDLEKHGIQHIVIHLTANGGQIILSDVVSGHQQSVATSYVALVEINIRVSNNAIGRDEVPWKGDSVDLLISVIKDVNSAVTKAKLHHVTSPEGNDIFVIQILHFEVGRHLGRALIHKVAVLIVDEGRSAIRLVTPRPNEDVARVSGPGLFHLELRRREVSRL